MALETLKGVEEIGGFEVGHTGKDLSEVTANAFSKHVIVNQAHNTISFILQNGPVKEEGVNGCGVETLIHAALDIIDGLNEKFPCDENAGAIVGLEHALMWLEKRKKDREQRGVALERFLKTLEDHDLRLDCHTDCLRTPILDNNYDEEVGAMHDNGSILWEDE